MSELLTSRSMSHIILQLHFGFYNFFQCYPAKVLFESFSVDSDAGLNPEKFEKICPALVEQIESKACLVENEEEVKEEPQSKSQGWYPVQTHHMHHTLNIQVSLRYRQYSLVSYSCSPIS